MPPRRRLLGAGVAVGGAFALGLGGEIAEFVDESDFACDPWFDHDAMAVCA